MYHSITFGDKNTWDDWHLIPSSRPVFNPPAPKYAFADIPGADGVEDFSELLTGYTLFSNREGSFEFIVMNGYAPWHEIYSDIMDHLHGRSMKAILEDDPSFYYEGRFTVNEWRSDPNWSRIVIDYNVAPYKLLKYSSTEDWLWDDIDFEQNCDISGLRAIEVDGTWTTTFRSLKRTIAPMFTIDSSDGNGMTVAISDDIGHAAVVDLRDGDKRTDSALRIYGPATTTISVTGKGIFSINFRMGRL